MTKNYIFDFGQVIVSADYNYMTSRYIKNEKDIQYVSDIVFDRLYWDKLDSGSISHEEVKKLFCERLPAELREAACLVYDKWYENLPIISGMPKLLQKVKDREGKLYLLSNISPYFVQNYSRVEDIKKVFDMFDGLVFSGQIGMVKPNSDIFEHILSKYSLIRSESVFIDDNPKNIEGAQRVGIPAILFDGDVDGLDKLLFGE